MLTLFRIKSGLAVLAILTLPISVFAAPSIQAQSLLFAQDGDQQLFAQARISQKRALELVRAQYAGNVVSITEISRRGDSYYRVRMDDNGNIFTLYVNAVSGAITRE